MPDVAPAIAVDIHGVSEVGAGHELWLAHGAGVTAGHEVWRDVTRVEDGERVEEFIMEEFRPPALERQRAQRIDHREFAGQRAIGRFQPQMPITAPGATL